MKNFVAVFMSMNKRPWNRVNLPIYSISTYDECGNSNMNICTYATQISMKPKRFAVAIYPNTKTFNNVALHKEFLLQYLSADNLKVARMLGKQSGLKTNKHKLLLKHTSQFAHFRYLNKAIAFIHLKVTSFECVGDHHLALCDVAAYKNIFEAEALTLEHLRKAKVISI